jgi:hypothetical protein
MSKCIKHSSAARDANATVTVDPIIGHVLATVGATVLGVALAPVIAGAVVGLMGFGGAGVIAGQSLVL